jgi:hypothetical protein
MKVVRGGSAALGSVVKDRPAGTEIGEESQKGPDLGRDSLAAMLYMGDREMGGENRARVAENQISAPVKNPFLAFREMLWTEETPVPGIICFGDVGEGVLDSFRIVLETDGKSPAGNSPLPDIPEGVAAPPEFRPRFLLLGQQLKTEFRKALPSFPVFKNGVNLLLQNSCGFFFVPRSDHHPLVAVHFPRFICCRARISAVRT